MNQENSNIDEYKNLNQNFVFKIILKEIKKNNPDIINEKINSKKEFIKKQIETNQLLSFLSKKPDMVRKSSIDSLNFTENYKFQINNQQDFLVPNKICETQILNQENSFKELFYHCQEYLHIFNFDDRLFLRNYSSLHKSMKNTDFILSYNTRMNNNFNNKTNIRELNLHEKILSKNLGFKPLNFNMTQDETKSKFTNTEMSPMGLSARSIANIFDWIKGLIKNSDNELNSKILVDVFNYFENDENEKV